ncbi:MAG: galactose mutarotase [Clostridia bacterium]|nr:galactose mutarotase [Clostridia bacterium]
MVTVKEFGVTKDGKTVLAYTMQDGDSKVVILNYGGTIQSLIVPDRSGAPVDVVLGYDDVEGYEKNGGFLGALIGRFGNRIGLGKMSIDGTEYQLFCNDRGNHLHGGEVGFDKKIWDVEIVGDGLKLSYLSVDGEENYPGNLKVEVVYTFVNKELKIEYTAVSDKKTAINLTNHAYFNLNGAGTDTAMDNVLWIDSDVMTPTNATMIPEGAFREVKGTAFDFNTPKAMGKDIDADDIELRQGNGYDHCHILKNGCGNFAKYAEVVSPRTGIVMECFTDMPAVQFYAGNGLNQDGKGGHYAKRSAFCLETQAIPNNVNVPAYAKYGSSIYDAGQVYHFVATYRFSVK